MDDAYKIACKNLTSLYEKQGIYAGRDHFTDYWARDSMFACFGALSLALQKKGRRKHLNVVKRNLELLSSNIHKSGQIPFRVGSKLIFLKMIGIKDPLFGPRYIQDKFVLRLPNNSATPTDSNSLFLIVSALYLSITNNRSFLNKHFHTMEKAIRWNTREAGKNGLMKEGPYCTWEDTVAKTGEVLYTNVLYYASLKSFIYICKLAGASANEYKKSANLVKRRINDRFWNGSYYIDWIDKEGKHDYFSTDGNTLAILFGLSEKQESQKIQKFIDSNGINSPVASKTNVSKNGNHGYPNKFIGRINRLFGFGNYHSTWIWPWLGCIDSAVCFRIGEKRKARSLLDQIGKRISRDEVCHEVYMLNGEFVDHGRWFRSEAPFAWTAGLYVFAYHLIKGNGLNKFFDKVFNK